jgi:hypothetical protein
LAAPNIDVANLAQSPFTRVQAAFAFATALASGTFGIGHA